MNYPPRRSRSERRRQLDIAVWRDVIDDDLDQNDREHSSLREEFDKKLLELQAAFTKSFEAIDKRGSFQTAILMVVMGALVTSAIGFAIFAIGAGP